MISVFKDEPFISHVPLVIQCVEQDLFLIGHFAKKNPHTKVLNLSKATVIFHGAHSYITPLWYAENDIPTWNYSAFHAIGDVELIENNEGLIECLKFPS